MGRVRNAESGFTLLEIMVAVGIVAMLGAAITPQMLGQLDKARRARATADMNVLASGLLRFYEDVGKMPDVNSGGWQDVYAMYTSIGTSPTVITGANCSSGWDTPVYMCNLNPQGVWAPYSETFKNALILNSRGYLNWKGPYINNEKADPWGHHYSSSMMGMTYPGRIACNPDSYWCRNSVVILSAGPNGIWETAAGYWDRNPCSGAFDPKACGDDLMVVVVNRSGATAASLAP